MSSIKQLQKQFPKAYAVFKVKFATSTIETEMDGPMRELESKLFNQLLYLACTVKVSDKKKQAMRDCLTVLTEDAK